MAIYKFRIIFEDLDEVQRDIEIRATQTFEDLHHAIMKAVGFSGKHPASFFMSDDYWKKGREIRLNAGTEKNDSKALAGNTKFCDLIADPHQKMYYVYESEKQWTFYVELIKIFPSEDPRATYPRCVKNLNEAPKEYGVTRLGKAPDDFDLPDTGISDTEGDEGEEESEMDFLTGEPEEDSEGEPDMFGPEEPGMEDQ